METPETTPISRRNFKLYHLPILPYFLIVDTIKNLKAKRYLSALAMLIITTIFLVIWLGGYAITAIVGYEIVKQNIFDKTGGNLVLSSIPQATTIVTPPPTPTPTPKPRKLDGGRLFNLVNAYRVKNGLSQFQWFHPLCEYSNQRAKQVATDWSHEGYLNDAKDGLLQQYCPDCIRTGENLAENYSTEEQILNAWIKSPTHKENLDYDWTYACAYFYGNKYVSMIFGKGK